MKRNKPVFVTRPTLPDLEEFLPYLREIWGDKILSNNGPFHQKLENELCDYLGVENISLYVNGTMALIAALEVLDIRGEVITTPFSFIATGHALLWKGINPIFADIDPVTFNLDPDKIEEAITQDTTAILPVHCYGNPCDMSRIQKIAEKHELKVIYDAAHAFGVKNNRGSILEYGNLSVLSFHATKVFNTFEGGAIVASNAELKNHLDEIRNFGISQEGSVNRVGINGKMSEINAAFGLLQLKEINNTIGKRERIDQFYRKELENISGIKCLDYDDSIFPNYSYFPIIVDKNCSCTRDEIYEELLDREIHVRRYFYPLISDYAMYSNFPSARSDNLKKAKATAESVICLPMASDLNLDEASRVTACIRDRVNAA